MLNYHNKYNMNINYNYYNLSYNNIYYKYQNLLKDDYNVILIVFIIIFL